MSGTGVPEEKGRKLDGRQNNKVDPLQKPVAWQCNQDSFSFLFSSIWQFSFIFSLQKKNKYFEAQEKALYSIATDYKGFITRDEQIVTLKNDAYVNYSVREGLKDSAWKHNLHDSGYQCKLLMHFLKEYSSAQILSTSSISTLKTKLEKAARHDLDSNFSLAYQDKK